MKKTLLALSMYCFINGFGQSQNAGLVSEQTVDISMALNSVIEVNQLSPYLVKVASTEPIILNYCDKYIFIEPGIHQIKVDINRYCHLIVVETKDTNLGQAEETKTIPNGMQTLDYFSNQALRTEDYIEYTICDTIIDRY
jgi:hypothetical protein